MLRYGFYGLLATTIGMKATAPDPLYVAAHVTEEHESDYRAKKWTETRMIVCPANDFKRELGNIWSSVEEGTASRKVTQVHTMKVFTAGEQVEVLAQLVVTNQASGDEARDHFHYARGVYLKNMWPWWHWILKD